mgnify:CR=1 FL=1
MNGVAPEAEEVGQLKEVRSHVTFTLFRFNRRKLWAFAAMGLRRSGLQDVPGLRFARMMGSGSGIGFSARPDFSRYALFAVWRNRASADAFFAESPFVEAYRNYVAAQTDAAAPGSDTVNASALPRGLTVAAPAGFVSKGSGLSNSVAGAVTLAIRAASSAVRGITFRCGASRSNAAAKTVVAAVAKKSWIK